MRHPYADFIHRIEKPARYLGGEYRSVVKDHAQVEVTLALAFPDLYDIGMSHLGTKILYSVLNRDPRIAAERCFAPWPDLERELRARRLPLVALESARALSEFDVVGFSLQFELTYTNVLLMLELGGIPLRSSERGEGHPLVIAGGPSATHPEPMADFLDAVLIGDGEERLPELLLGWKRARRAGLKREDALAELARLEGVYVPSLYDTAADPLSGLHYVSGPRREGVPARVRRALVADINRFPFPDDSPEPVAEAIFDRMAVEIARGCTEGCRFCQAGMITRPVRERDPRSIVQSVLGAVDKGGYDEVSLTALSTADVSCIAPLIEKVSDELARRKVAMSVSSLRAYGLPGEVLDDLSRVKAAGLTFAPEAGSQRMRDVISKNITDEDLEATAHRVFSRGWQKPKLYFMIGLPTEQDDDVRGIVDTGRRVREVGLKYQPRARVDVTVSVSTHVPKPHTPFQWCAMDPLDEIARKQALLAGLARSARVTLKTHDPRGSWLEGILGRGDRRLGAVIEQAYRAGARFDGWDEHLRLELWEQALATCGIDPAPMLATLPVDARLPWDHVDVGLEDGFLLKEYKKALNGRLSPPCGKPFHAQVHHTNLAEAEADQRKLVCYDCGVACDLAHMRQERIEFLQVLGARTPRLAVVPEAGTGEPAVPARRPSRRVDPQPRFVQGEPVWHRFLFTKLGRAAFTAHLDLVRVLPRIFRRAGIGLQYSLGFNPHPLMSFGPALSLGVASLGEPVEVALSEQHDPDDLLARLAGAVPEGIAFVGARPIPTGQPSLGKILAFADYLVALPVEPAALEPAAGRTIVVERKREKREVDLGAALVEARLVPAALVPPALELGEADAWLYLRLKLDGGLKPGEAAEAICGHAGHAVGRLGVYGSDGRDALGGLPSPVGDAAPEARASA